ncbi:lysozyme [Agrobacterium salinitolerans]|uniref:lysozyme n=1 Tax=Agrobacterium salinitolerans TaxID=1183413 RepID=UPI001C24E078|nr:lysozyme [Agrobacterium salinitolerans]QXC49521.1 lysozyme [Agrobacterium salinitolerans]
MPINKIDATKRGKSAVAAALALAIATGWATLFGGSAPDTPAEIRAAIARGYTPPAVQLAIDKLIKPWEGIHLTAYRDIVGVPTICWGETKGVTMGMRKTLAECDAMLRKRVIEDYYLPLVDNGRGFLKAPDSVQASMISGAYNFGVGSTNPRRGQLGSTAMFIHIPKGEYRKACEAQTAWNKAGGRVVRGLVNRREMGDAQRLGEAELCVSGLPSTQNGGAK